MRQQSSVIESYSEIDKDIIETAVVKYLNKDMEQYADKASFQKDTEKAYYKAKLNVFSNYTYEITKVFNHPLNLTSSQDSHHKYLKPVDFIKLYGNYKNLRIVGEYIYSTESSLKINYIRYVKDSEQVLFSEGLKEYIALKLAIELAEFEKYASEEKKLKLLEKVLKAKNDSLL